MTSVLGIVTAPSALAYLLFLLGLLAAAWAGTRKVSWWLLAGSGLIFTVFSSGMVAAALMSPLDYAYPTLRDPLKFPAARHIVVLTGWAADDADMPLTGRMGGSTAYRVLLTLELYNERPDCDVILSGDADTARIMADVLNKLGVPRDKLRLEDESGTTAQSAANLKSLLGRDEFFLVTSAAHLPRSLGAIAKQGLHAIPAPTDHQLARDWRRAELHPTPSSLVISDRAWHEYLGLLWYRLRGAL